MAELPARLEISRSFFGMDSFSDPQTLELSEYVASMNTVSRGGIVQTRPGSRVMACAPSHENLQGLTFFQPTGGLASLVLVCDGNVYTAPAPFTNFTRLAGIGFSPYAKYVSFAVCLQSTDYDDDGALFALASPRSVLVMQDGQSRAAFWDGSTARHLNPELSPVTPLWASAIRLASNGSVVDDWSAPVIFATGTFDPPVAGVGEIVRVAFIRSDTTPTVPIDTQGTGWSLDVPEVGTKSGFDETKIGLWMAWSNNRLWVAREGQVFASDIGNPLKFTESQYIAEGRAFYLDDDCTGIVELTDQSGILVFTKDNATVIRSSITDRTQWLNTPDFQQVVLQQVGCVAPRSIIVQYGLIWWFSAKGVTALDAALRQNLTSKLMLLDQEIIASKFNCSPDLSMICGSFFENYLLMSVPSGDVWNRHTWVLDQDPFPGTGVNANSWNSWWSGWRPVQWARGIVDGNERLFFLSRDFDGKGRVWESMTADRSDNGCAITCALQTREHNFGDMEYKRFKMAELYLKEAYGSVSFMTAYKSTKGPWTRVLTKQIEATAGQIYEDAEYSDDGHKFTGNRPQSRTIRTSETAVTDVPCQADCGVESPNIPAYVDHAFSLLMVWSGRAGVYGYKIVAMAESSDYLIGRCEEDETAPRSVETDGSAALSFFTSCNPFPAFSGVGTFSATNETCGGTVAFNATATSIISQADADNKAECKALTQAQCYADGQCGNPVFCNAEQTVTVSVDCGNGIRVCDGAIPVSISCSSLTGSAQLCGISGYDDGTYDAGQPENWVGQYQKWTIREISGSLAIISGGGAVPECGGSSTGNNDNSTERVYTGSYSVDCTGLLTNAVQTETYTDSTPPPDVTVSNVSAIPSFGTAILSACPAPAFDLYFVESQTLTTRTVAGCGCAAFTEDPKISTGTATETLTDEVTVYSALQEQGGTPGTECATSIEFGAFTSPGSTSSVQFEGTAVKDTFTIGDEDSQLIPGNTYTATITLTKTPNGGGDPVIDTVAVEFIADAPIDTIEYEVPAEAGFSVVVTNVEVISGDIPCDGSVSASFTVPANAYCASAQVVADRIAYNYAIEQATVAAQAQLTCTYGNEAQSYTARCPGELGDGEVVPAGAAIGNPVTVTIPAGTYTASTVAEANALALADAMEQAVAERECFWTNTEQTQEYCCDPGLIVSGAGNPAVDGYYLPVGIINDEVAFYLNGDTSSYVVKFSGTEWSMGISGSEDYYTLGNNPPWDETWLLGDGADPAPTVTQWVRGCGQATVPFNTYNSSISQMDANTLALAAAYLEAEASITCLSDTSDGSGEPIII